MRKRIEGIITGNVQGVFFRSTAKEHADHLGITGYAKNQPDGAMHIIAEGEEDALEDFTSFLHDGPPMADVKDVHLAWAEPSNAFNDFTIA